MEKVRPMVWPTLGSRTAKEQNRRHVSTTGKIIKQQYVLQMTPQCGELRPTSGRDRFASLGHPVIISTAFMSWQRYCAAVKQWASAKLCGVEQRAPLVFGRATITLDIGPHSSLSLLLWTTCAFYDGYTGTFLFPKKHCTATNGI